MYDLIIIGGGPAGTSAGITAVRAGARVLLLERGAFPRHKVCGEFVSAESLALLSSLLKSSSLLEASPKIARARLFIDGRMLDTTISPPAAGISRFDLDAQLFYSARVAGVDACEHAAAHGVDGNGPFRIRTATETFESRCLINATGRWSNLSPQSHNGNDKPKWIGLKGHFVEPDAASSVDLYFFEGGYCGVQPVNLPCRAEHAADSHFSINVCAMARADVAVNLPEVFARSPALLERSRNWQPLTTVVTTSPLIFRRPQPTTGNLLLAGDAAGFVDPFVGDGISLALRSGALAAQSLLAFFEGKITLQQAAHNYRNAYEKELLPVFGASSKIRRLFALPKLVRVPLMSFAQGTPRITQYLIRKTR